MFILENFKIIKINFPSKITVFKRSVTQNRRDFHLPLDAFGQRNSSKHIRSRRVAHIAALFLTQFQSRFPAVRIRDFYDTVANSSIKFRRNYAISSSLDDMCAFSSHFSRRENCCILGLHPIAFDVWVFALKIPGGSYKLPA